MRRGLALVPERVLAAQHGLACGQTLTLEMDYPPSPARTEWVAVQLQFWAIHRWMANAVGFLLVQEALLRTPYAS